MKNLSAENVLKIRFLVAFVNLLIVAALGVVMRADAIFPIQVYTFKNVLHAHSHVAILGWTYMAFFAFLVYAFVKPEKQNSWSFNIQFLLTQISVVGMLISFTLYGYGFFSIVFSTSHILLSYYFIFSIIKDRSDACSGKQKHSYRFLKAALFFMALSSLGPWGLGYFMSQGIGGEIYSLCISFYLHFQYNGWLAFAAFGVLLWLVERKSFDLPQQKITQFFYLLFFACFPAFLTNIIIFDPPVVVHALAVAGAGTQIIAFLLLVSIFTGIKREKPFGSSSNLIPLLNFLFLFLGLKILFQFLLVFPVVAEAAFKIRLFTIGYLHLAFLGFISFALIIIAFALKLLNYKSAYARWGIQLFLIAFITSESLIFLQALWLWLGYGYMPQFHLLLLLISCLFPLSLAMVFTTARISFLSQTRHENNFKHQLITSK